MLVSLVKHPCLVSREYRLLADEVAGATVVITSDTAPISRVFLEEQVTFWVTILQPALRESS